MPDFFSAFTYRFLTLPDQTKIAYLDEGPVNAPVLLLLHGLGDNAHVWAQAISELKKHFRCLAIDLPGHGQTVVRNFSYKMYAFADVVSAFVQQLKIQEFTLVGHSMGGQISIILALRLPAIIGKLVLVAPAGFEQFTEAEKKILLLGASFGNGWQSTKNDRETDRKTALQKSMEGMLQEPVFDYLPQLQVPTLVIFGEQDAFIPNRYFHHQTTATIAEAGTAQIPNSALQLFQNCSHYPQSEQPAKFNTAVLKFLKK